ncbi:MAG: LiaI-LiaF-like domain-containing protein [Thermoanaerobaculia bacterium]
MNPAENWQTAAGPIAAEPEPAPAFTPQHAAVIPPPVGRKNPFLAALLSAFPGMGNVYNGLYMRGLTFFLIIVSLLGITTSGRGHELFGMAVAFFWLFNVIDAYRQATLINYGYAQDLGLLDMPRVPRAGQGGLVAGVLLTLVGIASVLDRYTIIDYDWFFRLWPFALVAVGVWLIAASFRDRQRG